MKFIALVIILALCVFAAPLSFAQTAQTEKTYSDEPHFWEPFYTWFVDATTYVFTGEYPPEAEEQPHPATQRVRRVDAYKHGCNPWFW